LGSAKDDPGAPSCDPQISSCWRCDFWEFGWRFERSWDLMMVKVCS
jgi:hypothetical protein